MEFLRPLFQRRKPGDAGADQLRAMGQFFQLTGTNVPFVNPYNPLPTKNTFLTPTTSVVLDTPRAPRTRRTGTYRYNVPSIRTIFSRGPVCWDEEHPFTAQCGCESCCVWARRDGIEYGSPEVIRRLSGHARPLPSLHRGIAEVHHEFQ